ncbi:MAG: hypothetical protein HUU57_15360 [Bdellovibrio sp.]|nr:hypothetical protein [Bdellovibrio sp.]
MATVVGAIASLIISGYAIWFSKKLSDDSNEIAIAIKSNTEAIQKQTEAVHKHTKILRLDNLRTLYELSRGDDTRHNFWHFRWRFETYDRLGCGIYEVQNGQEIYLGGCDLQIQGFSNFSDHIGFEARESDFYIVKVLNSSSGDDQDFPFQNGELLACFDQQGQLMISKGVDPWTTEQKYRLSIGGMGHHQIFSGERTVETMTIFPRIKDS